jgi:hypothetical protein
MHREFCTLFDSNYLYKAVAMHGSMERNFESFGLTCFCFDEQAQRLVDELGLPGVRTVSLADLEAFDPELLAVKGDRTAVEYCWTATPSLPLYMLDADPTLSEVTYIDADLFFFSDPEPIYDEMGDDAVLLTPHRYAPAYAFEELSGIYNVSFMVFRRQGQGLECLQWWHDRCIEWCYFRYEDGKIGDQGYLNDFPRLFDGVHSLEHPGGGLAPWNVTNHRLRPGGDGVLVDGEPLLFFHYHGFGFSPSRPHHLAPANYHLPRRARRLIYAPYVDALEQAVEQVRAVDPAFSAGYADPMTWRERMRRGALWARARQTSYRNARERKRQLQAG